MVNKQDYINAVNQNIDMVRGDNLVFNFQLKGLGSIGAYAALIVTFAVAEHYDDVSIFECTNGSGIELENYDAECDTATFSVFVAPNKTKTLDLARYYYDLQIKNDSNVVTLMRGILTIVYDVAD